MGGGQNNVQSENNVNGLVDDENDPHSAFLLSPDPEVEEDLCGELLSEIIDEQEVADLLDDAEANQCQVMERDEEGDIFYVEEPEEPDDEELSVCEPAALVQSDEEPELMSEEEVDVRPQRERTAPGRYNPESGRSYAQV